MDNKKFITTSAQNTQKAGEGLAKDIFPAQGGPASGGKTAVVLGLEGNLGGGKTTFLQGFARGLGIKDKILSPTFVIMKKFSVQGGPTSGRKNFYHIDCYRLKKGKDILELGWEEIISNPKNIVAVEWPKKIKKVLPKNTITLKFKFISETKREILLKI